MKKPKLVPMFYMGRRLNAKGKLCHAFQSLKGETSTWAKIKSTYMMIGSAYTAEESGKDSLLMEHRPKRFDGVEDAPQKDIDAWTLASELAEQTRRTEREIAKAKIKKHFIEQLDGLEHLTKGKSYSQLVAIATFMVDYWHDKNEKDYYNNLNFKMLKIKKNAKNIAVRANKIIEKYEKPKEKTK
jgi:hypothetical protein